MIYIEKLIINNATPNICEFNIVIISIQVIRKIQIDILRITTPQIKNTNFQVTVVI